MDDAEKIERRRAASRAWRERNLERARRMSRDSSKAYYHANRDKKLAATREFKARRKAADPIAEAARRRAEWFRTERAQVVYVERSKRSQRSFSRSEWLALFRAELVRVSVAAHDEWLDSLDDLPP
jgi:hypothetical protein